MSLDRFGNVIHGLYAAAADPNLWTVALRAVGELTGSVGAVIDFAPVASGAAGFTLSGGFSTEQCATYASDHMPHCRRIKMAIAHPELDLLYDSLVMSEQEMDRDPVQDWLGKQGIRYFVGGNLVRTTSYQAAFSLQRSPGAGHVQRPDIELYRLLRPHVAQAVTLAESVETLQGRQSFAAAVLDRLPHAVFALDRQGRIVFANLRGEDLRRQDRGLFDGDRLKGGSDAETRALHKVVLSAVEPESSSSGGWVRISRRSSALPLHVFVCHIGDTMTAQLTRRPVVLVIVYDRLDKASPEAGALQALFGLTAAEARLTLELVAGHSVESAARVLDIAPSTARSHLKSIFRKTEVSRQQDLAALVLPFAGAASAA